MKRFFISLAVLLAGLFTASEIWPAKASNLLLSTLHLATGMTAKTVDTSKGQIQYLEGGSGDTVVFLHGIFARKEHWLDMSRQIKDHRLILLDLPGFGDNPVLDAADYDFAQQVTNIFETLDAMGVEKFHLVGNSMGSQIASMMAADRPDQIITLSYIGSPVGVTSPIPSDMETAIAKGTAPLVVKDQAGYDARMAWLFPKEPFLPRPMARTWAAAEIARADSNQMIWDAVNGSQITPSDHLAPDLAMPTLVIWCQDDRIFHPTGAQILADALPNSTLITPSGCGHLPMLDRPAETGRDLQGFLSAH
ncbi:alpha/beta hydrolase [uncultured Pelagimonas sp.]|uniref:alpha/beta fold hydrolase n=1 Tax=uncultured Pelagimonas sp. TaxID=1618102 RepID=UPI0026191404|nr:alpha/beta hydrolase [uncultured Pelagimonas sp.]